MTFVIRSAAIVGDERDLGPVAAARDAWPSGVAPHVAERRLRLVTTDVREAWPGAPDRIARMDRITRLALLAVHRLAVSSPIEPSRDEPVGIAFASALATLGTNETFDRRYHAREARSGRALGDAHLFPYTAPNAAAGEIAIAFGAHGPVVVSVGGGCADLTAFRALAAEPGVRRWIVVVADVLSPAALVWLDTSGVLASSADERETAPVATEGAIAFLLDDVEGPPPSDAPSVVRVSRGVRDPGVGLASHRRDDGLVRYGFSAGFSIASRFLRSEDVRGTWESRCPTGAWVRLDLG